MRILIALALSLATLPFLATPASAVGPSNIVVDGNQAGTTDDWQGWQAFPNGNLAEGFSVIRDGVGNGDLTGIDGQEDHNDGVGSEQDWVANKATASGKSDIGNVLVDSYRGGTQNHLFAAIGFDRGNGSGTQRYYLEFNQAAHDSIMPTRTTGDLRVILAVNGNGLEECQGAQQWTAAGTWGAVQNCSGNIAFMVNGAPIDDYFGSPYLTNGKIPANQFFEVSIDLTGLGATSCPVSGFKTFDMRTQEGNENGQNGQLKDVLWGPIDIPSDCGTIKIVKLDADTGLPVTVAGAMFEITPDPTAGSSNTGSKTVVDNNTTPADLTDADPAVGKITVTGVDPDTYTVEEIAAPAGYFLPPPPPDPANCPPSGSYSCLKGTVTAPAGGANTVTFTFSDEKQWAAPTISKTADGSVTTSYTWQVEKTVSNTRNDTNAGDSATQSVPPGQPATFYYGIKVTGTKHVGTYAVTGSVKVVNPNDSAMVVTLSDTLHDGTVCAFTGADFAPGTPGHQVNVPANAPGGTSYAYTCAPSAATPQPGDNTARVTWSTNAYPQTAQQAWATQPGTDYREATDGYSYTPQGETNKSVSVSDTYGEFGGPKTVTFDPNDLNQAGKYVKTFQYSKTFTGDPAGTCTPHVNTARVDALQAPPTAPALAQDSATATVCSGANLTVTKNKVVSLTRTYAYSIDKSVADSTLEVGSNGKATAHYTVVVTDGAATDSNWAMAGKITVVNPNDWVVTLSSITDSYQGTACSVVQGANLNIPADGQRVFDYSCFFASVPPYSGTNTATVTWDATTARTSGNTASGTASVAPADWTLSQVNPTVHVVDDKTVPGASNPLGTVTWTSPGTQHSFSYSLELQGTPGRCVSYTNTARITETGQSDSATVQVCHPVNPTVDKTAGGTYDRTYLWEIVKEADRTSVRTDGVDGAEVDYTVSATPDGYVDSGWTMNGTITVSNPNDFKSMTVDITDVPNVGPGATCTVTNGLDVVVPAAQVVNNVLVPGTATRDYTCDVPQQPLYEGGTNTAVITWDGGAASSAPEPVVFALAGETDRTVTVVDDKTVPGNEVELGQATWNAEGTATTFTYTLELEAKANACEEYTNTAEIVETGQFDDATVEACGPEVLPEDEVRPRPPVVKGVDTVLPSTGGPDTVLLYGGVGLVLLGGALMLSRRTRRSEV